MVVQNEPVKLQIVAVKKNQEKNNSYYSKIVQTRSVFKGCCINVKIIATILLNHFVC